MRTDEALKNSLAVALGAPTIDPTLSEATLSKLLTMAAEAPVTTECGALDSAVGDSKESLAVDVFRKLMSQHAGVPCQIVFDQVEDGTYVISAFCGNGSKSREAARLYAVARDAIIALVRHAQAKQKEIDSLRLILAPPPSFGDPEDGGL